MLKRFLQSSFFRRFWRIAGAASIRVKVLGIVLGVVLLLGAFVILQVNALLTRTLLVELAHQGIALSEQMAESTSDVMARNSSVTVAGYLHNMQTHYSDESHSTIVDYIAVVSPTGSVIAGAGSSRLPTTLEPYTGMVSDDPSVHLALNDRILEVTTPLADRQTALRLGLSRANIRDNVNSVLLRLIAITAVMVAVGFAAAIFLIGILTRPILELVDATGAVERGEFHTRVSRWADDEIGELASAFNAMAASLQEAEEVRAEQESLRRRYVSGVILAQEGERSRIARELHDSTSQSLTSLLVGLQNLKLAGDKDALYQYIDDLRDGVGQTLDEVRTIAWRLRPNTLDDLGLISALQQYINDYQKRHGIPVDYAVSGISTRLPPELETTIYRIVQEGLTNIARYAQATAASVLISHRQDLIRIVVEDDGIGFDPEIVQRANHSLGLQGIRERAELFNGKLTIESQPGQGASLFVEIPYPSVEDGPTYFTEHTTVQKGSPLAEQANDEAGSTFG